METTTLTKTEYNYLKSIDTLNLALDKAKEKQALIESEFEKFKTDSIEKQKKLVTDHLIALKEQRRFISDKDFEIKKMLREIESTNRNLIESRTMSRQAQKISDERIAELGKENSKLKVSIEYLEHLIDEKQDDFDNLNKSAGENIASLENKLKESITKLPDVVVTAEPIIESPTVIETPTKIEPKIEEVIQNHLNKNAGLIHEKILEKIDGVKFDEGGIMKLALGGSITLKKNFLSPMYSLKE